MIVYQTDAGGGFVGPTTADFNPLVADEFIIPGGCVETAPPAFGPGQRAVFYNDAWAIEPNPVLIFAGDPTVGVAVSWDGAVVTALPVHAPALVENQTATWNGATWDVVTTAPPVPPNAPISILSQALMKQFSGADMVKIMAAVSGDTTGQTALLWYSMVAQSDPMLVSNASFQAGWAALVKVLGPDRMNAIGAVLGVPKG
jgi:hypothetical protein